MTGYDVYRNGARIATTNTTSYSNAGLTADTTYSYAVDAFDAAGNISAQSGTITVTTPTAGQNSIFAVGARVRTTMNVSVFSTSTSRSPVAGIQPLGATGTISAGPVRHSGHYEWSINFYSGVDGWVLQDYLALQ